MSLSSAAIQKEEAKETDGDHAVEEDLVVWLPFDVSILLIKRTEIECHRLHVLKEHQAYLVQRQDS